MKNLPDKKTFSIFGKREPNNLSRLRGKHHIIKKEQDVNLYYIVILFTNTDKNAIDVSKQ